MNPTRTGILRILRAMGADITESNPRIVGGEPVADLRVRGAHLRGIEIAPELVPLAIDEFPVLFVAAACAEGTTLLRGRRRTAGQGVRPDRGDGRRPAGDRHAGHAHARRHADRGAGSGAGAVRRRHGRSPTATIASPWPSRSPPCASRSPITILDTENVDTSFPRFAEMAAVGRACRSQVGSGQ